MAIPQAQAAKAKRKYIEDKKNKALQRALEKKKRDEALQNAMKKKRKRRLKRQSQADRFNMDDHHRESNRKNRRNTQQRGVSKGENSRRRLFWLSDRARKRAEQRSRRRSDDREDIVRSHLGGVFD